MYKLPPLPYAYNDLEPYYDGETLKIHYEVLLKRYTDNLNKALSELDKARKENDYEHIKALENDLSFNGSGYLLHIMFFYNLTPNQNKQFDPKLLIRIINDFYNFESFKNQFMEAANKVEGSGWCILGYSKDLDKLLILQCEKHQNLTIWGIRPLLVIDVWEHAYYLQYKADRKKYLENIWEIIDWEIVSERYNKSI